MIQFSQSQLDAKWDLLNPEIREAILSDKIDNLVNAVLQRHNLGGASESVITLCVYAVHGLLDQNLFFSELTAIVGREISPALAKDLIGEVIIPILSLKPEEEAEADRTPERGIGLTEPVAKEPVAAQPPAAQAVAAITPGAAPAPFVIHAEAEAEKSVMETRKSLAEPVRPKFYEERNGSSDIASPPSYAKLQFAAPEVKPEGKQVSIKPDFPEKSEPFPESHDENDKRIELKDLPL